jgi:hypothetical protein
VRDSLAPGPRGLRAAAARQPFGAAALLFLLAPLAVAFLLALCPPTISDEVGYHLTGPKRWLQAGALCYVPTLMHLHTPVGMHMLYTLTLALGTDTAARLFHFVVGLAAVAAVLALSRRLAGSWALGVPVVAFLLFWCGPNAGLTEMSWAFVDLGLVLYVACALLAYSLWRGPLAGGDAEGVGWWRVAALCAGLTATVKLTGIFVGLTLAAAAAYAVRRERGAGGSPLRSGVLFFLLALLPLLPWSLRSFLLTGNPVYPALASVVPTRDWSPALSHAFDLYFRFFIWAPTSPMGLEKRRAIWGVFLGLVVGFGAVLAWAWRGRREREVPLVGAALVLAAAGATGLSPRLLYPFTLPLVFAFCVPLAPFLARNRVGQALSALLLIAGGLLYLRRHRADVGPAWAAATGRLARPAYLERAAPDLTIWEAVNRLPDDGVSTVATLAYYPAVSVPHGMTYYCDRFCFTSDAWLQRRFDMTTYDGFLADLKRDHVRYVVVPRQQLYHGIEPEYAPARNEYPFARRIADEHGHRLASAGGVDLFDISGALEGVTPSSGAPAAPMVRR